jgi:hypothetical protein
LRLRRLQPCAGANVCMGSCDTSTVVSTGGA